MAFCVKCGNKLEEGEKFCGNCGNAVDSSVTNSPRPSANYVKNNNVPVPNMNLDTVGDYMKEILNISLNIIKKPISSIVDQCKTLKKESTFILLAML